MTKVTIYQFSIYDVNSDEPKISRRWGTVDGIKAVGGSFFEHTHAEVDGTLVGAEVPGLTARDFMPHHTRHMAA